MIRCVGQDSDPDTLCVKIGILTHEMDRTRLLLAEEIWSKYEESRMKPFLLPSLLMFWLSLVLGCEDTPPTNRSSATRGDSSRSASPIINMEETVRRAKAENKLIFLEFSSANCGYCKKMEMTTFADPRVKEKLAEYVTVFVDADRNPGLREQYRVPGFPAHLVLKPDRTVVNLGAGLMSSDEFLRWLEDARW